MTFGAALIRARGQLIFLAGLIIASAVVMALDRQDCVPASLIDPVPRLVFTPSAEITAAWAYVERNRTAATGLVNADEGSGWTTAADAGHALRATVAAQRLRLITGRDGYERVAAIMRTLDALPSDGADDRIDTHSGQRVTGGGRPAVPLVAALELIAWSYPPSRDAALRQIEKWQGAPAAGSAGPVFEASTLERNAAVLVRTALSQRGES